MQIGQRSFSAVITKEGELFSSLCPELDVASSGDTSKEAFENLKDAVKLYLKTLAEEGELKSVLEAKRRKYVKEQPR
ncbi:MAG: type II toxin-antitoxin system HicB family antitoxin [Chloroflexi bacterium]|nr:type II toxin-antitoxin system HicB family antitoxin [Chloroflexota bacterium]